jgi:hypothetical protein
MGRVIPVIHRDNVELPSARCKNLRRRSFIRDREVSLSARSRRTVLVITIRPMTESSACKNLEFRTTNAGAPKITCGLCAPSCGRLLLTMAHWQ